MRHSGFTSGHTSQYHNIIWSSGKCKRVQLLARVTAALDNRKSPVSIKLLTGGKQYCCSFSLRSDLYSWVSTSVSESRLTWEDQQVFPWVTGYKRFKLKQKTKAYMSWCDTVMLKWLLHSTGEKRFSGVTQLKQ